MPLHDPRIAITAACLHTCGWTQPPATGDTEAAIADANETLQRLSHEHADQTGHLLAVELVSTDRTLITPDGHPTEGQALLDELNRLIGPPGDDKSGPSSATD